MPIVSSNVSCVMVNVLSCLEVTRTEQNLGSDLSRALSPKKSNCPNVLRSSSSGSAPFFVGGHAVLEELQLLILSGGAGGDLGAEGRLLSGVPALSN